MESYPPPLHLCILASPPSLTLSLYTLLCSKEGLTARHSQTFSFRWPCNISCIDAAFGMYAKRFRFHLSLSKKSLCHGWNACVFLTLWKIAFPEYWNWILGAQECVRRLAGWWPESPTQEIRTNKKSHSGFIHFPSLSVVHSHSQPTDSYEIIQ